MAIPAKEKEFYKNKIRDALCKEPEVQRIVLFGSFIRSESPNDIDVAVFQSSDLGYLSLSMKYRRMVREISKILPIDIFPVKMESQGSFLDEIEDGETIYER